MDLSFPKKSYFTESEVLSILNWDKNQLRVRRGEGLFYLMNESGKRLYLREDILIHYAKSESQVTTVLSRQDIESFKETFNDALADIYQIKKSRSEIWHNL